MTTHPTSHAPHASRPGLGRLMHWRGVPLGLVLLAILAAQAVVVWAGVALFRAF